MAVLTQSYMTGESSGQLLYQTIGHCFDEVVNQYPENEFENQIKLKHTVDS